MLQIYNTLSRAIEVFEPFSSELVKMYICGPTVYDYSHLGHARTYVAFDVIKRYLRLKGYNVFHVQNITDIDDKIIRRASDEGASWTEIADTYTKDYLESLEKLNVNVDFHPRVTKHIDDIVRFIERLVDKGYAYVTASGNVYFDVDSFDDYGRLSGIREKKSWNQKEEVTSEKKHPYDFALWKATKPGEPSWKSPWGYGRPGWHIECSVMSTKYLGNRIDIHGGGSDLIFPHHENERAQSEAALNVRPWVKYWLHSGMLMIKGEKMSKSLGNIVSLKEAFKKWRPEVLRLWLCAAHYRTVLSFSEDAMQQFEANYERLVNALENVRKILKGAEPSFDLSEDDAQTLEALNSIRQEFYRFMDYDFNTSAAFSQIRKLTNIVFRKILDSPEHVIALKAFSLFDEFNKVLGVLDKHIARTGNTVKTDALIDILVEVRSRLRKRRDYELADWIRSELIKLGIKLLDSPEKTIWRYI